MDPVRPCFVQEVFFIGHCISPFLSFPSSIDRCSRLHPAFARFVFSYRGEGGGLIEQRLAKTGGEGPCPSPSEHPVQEKIEISVRLLEKHLGPLPEMKRKRRRQERSRLSDQMGPRSLRFWSCWISLDRSAPTGRGKMVGNVPRQQ